jgi:Insertion element 4 transposase N-terminal/Transposase DDE domain
MPLIVRPLPARPRLSDVALFDALERVLPRAAVRAVLAELDLGERRCRKLPAELTLLLAVGAACFPREALDRVLVKLLRGVRLLGLLAPPAAFEAATKGAICQARYRLGARPLAALFRRLCRPLASPETPGAFLFGLRVMALDSTLAAVPDTPANARAFGRPTNQRGAAGFPLVRGVYLVECGTHAVVDAGFWPYAPSEHRGARRLLRSVTAGMLVTYDCGLHSADLIAAVRARDAHVLGRVPAGVRLPAHEPLPDGSYLAWLTTGRDWQRPRERRRLVRVVAYTLTDPHRPGYGERHRLLTTLLDPRRAPALDLVVGYHERWEVELAIDEQDAHLRQAQPRLRSQHPLGVLQELYGLLLAHYAVRALMAEAAAGAEPPLDPRRLSFVHAVQLITDALPEFQLVDPAAHEALYARLLADLRRHRLPSRADRQNPRVLRFRRRKYPPKRPEHTPWPQPTKPFRHAVQLLI